jgi:hypothetical protein
MERRHWLDDGIHGAPADPAAAVRATGGCVAAWRRAAGTDHGQALAGRLRVLLVLEPTQHTYRYVMVGSSEAPPHLRAR